MHSILIDVTRCRGCEQCVAACVKENELDPVRAARDRITAPDGLSAHRLSSLVRIDDDRFVRKSCLHCLDPACVSACLVGGLTRTPGGAVIYDADKCIGCRYCMLACPFHVPRYEWERTLPFVRKCEMCPERLAAGSPPACVEACPYDALEFGERDELLSEARRRMETHPDRYLEHIWGETEFGGTSVIYISDVDLTAIGWPKDGAASIPAVTEPLIAKTPHIALGVAGVLLGVSWIVRRRDEIAAQRAATESRPEAPRSEEMPR
jgi:formate dehydrogenase iron-sulfur subunit